MNKQVKTFSNDSWTMIDGVEVNLEGVRYVTTEYFWCLIVEDDSHPLSGIEIPQDEVYAHTTNGEA